MTDLADFSAVDLVAAYRTGRASPVEATKAALARAAAWEARLNTFCYRDDEAALAAAKESEARWQRKAPLGVLDGVPTTVKDTIMMKGVPFRRGSRTTDPDQRPTEDAPIVERIRRHGAIILGKTNTPEMGWKGVTDSALFGITRNPWNVELTPGGSSGGAAAGIAAGMSQLALGTDGGGSIRIPASFSNVVGFKATGGRIPVYPVSPFGSLANHCPMARTVADVALLLTATRGPDARDWESLPDASSDFSQGLEGGVKGMRIAFSPAFGYANVDPEVAAIVGAAAERLSDLGADVEETDPGIPDPTPIFWTHWCAGASFAIKNLTPDQQKLVEEGFVRTAELGNELSLFDFQVAAIGRQSLAQFMSAYHQTYDLLVLPTLAVPPFPVGQLSPTGRDPTNWLAWTPFTYVFNLTKQPAISVPCGFTKSGLPVGLQIVGPLHGDAKVLRAAHAYEQAHDWYRRRPVLA